MVEEVGYTSRVRVQAGQQLPGVSADSFGAGVGQAIEQAGAVIQQEQLEDARIDRQLRDNAEWSAFLVADATAREELSALARDGRLSDQPGHAARIAAELGKREEALLATVTSPRLKQQARARLSEWGTSLKTREADYEFVRGQEIAIKGFEEQRGIAEGRVRRLENPSDYAAELKLQVDAINTLNTSDKVKQSLIDETEQQFAIAYLRGMTDRDPLAARAVIDSGAFDGVLTGDQVEVLRNGSEVEIRRLEAERDRERDEQVRALRQQITMFETAEKLGLVEDDAKFDEAIAAATAIGDQKTVLELTVMKTNRAFTRVWGPENATALQREQRITALASQDKRSDQENLELAFLRKHQSSWAAEEARDPVGQAARRGGSGAPPVVDFNDPASIAARGRWAEARSAEGRRVPAFTQTEARELGQLYDSGRQGEEQVLAILAALPAGQAMESAKLIEPNDKTLPIIATLDPLRRNMARRGREALRADKNLLFNMLREDPELDEAFTARRAEFEDALRNVPPEQRSAIFETAKQIAAGQVDKFGETLTPALWDTSLKLALGGQKVDGEWQGGLAKWADRPYLLPAGVSHTAFKAAVIREVQATEDPPVNPDGSTANLYRLAPVAVGEGTYEFRNAAGDPVRRKSGKVYRVRVRPQ